MTDATSADTRLAQFNVDLAVGRRGVRWPFGRLLIDCRALAVRSAVTRWIPLQSVSKEAVGDISVVKLIEIKLPILRWRRLEVVRFGAASPFADITIKVRPRKRIVEALRSAGYSVTDVRT